MARGLKPKIKKALKEDKQLLEAFIPAHKDIRTQCNELQRNIDRSLYFVKKLLKEREVKQVREPLTQVLLSEKQITKLRENTYDLIQMVKRIDKENGWNYHEKEED